MSRDQPLLYLDNNATTAVDPAVLEEMLPYLGPRYANPSSPYGPGRAVAAALATARERVAALIGASPEEILFTSCGTESDNSAIESALRADPDRRHLVTTAVEHSAIHKHADRLARQGHRVSRIGVDPLGRIDPQEIAAAIDDETALVAVMWANNETGILFPVERIAEIAAERGVPFHTDAVQAVGKIPVDVSTFPVQTLALSGHKLHAPKGVGALYISRKTRFHPLLIGGGQENGRRGGTENVASIVGFGKACELAASRLETERAAVRALRDRFEQRVLSEIPGVRRNGDPEHRLPNTSSLAFDGCDAEGLLILLDRAGLCASAGSACTTGSLSPSHVLTAMGFDAARARSTLRFSFGRFNRPEEADTAATLVAEAVTKLRSLRSADETVRLS